MKFHPKPYAESCHPSFLLPNHFKSWIRRCHFFVTQQQQSTSGKSGSATICHLIELWCWRAAEMKEIMKQKQSEVWRAFEEAIFCVASDENELHFVSAKTLSFITAWRAGVGEVHESRDKTSKKLLSCRGRNQSWWKFNSRWIGAWSQMKLGSKFITGRFAKTFEQIVQLRVWNFVVHTSL